MGRRYGYNGSAKTIAATTAQTLTWTSSELPSSNVLAFHIALRVAGNTLADLDRIRVKAGSVTIVDCSATQLLSFNEQFSSGNYAAATTAQALTIPFWDLLANTAQEEDLQQFPYGAPATVELTTGAGTAAGSAFIGWTMADPRIRPMYYPRLLSSGHGVGVSAVNGRAQFTEPGELQAIGIPSAGLLRARILASGEELFNMQGLGLVATAQGDMVNEASRLYGVNANNGVVWARLQSGAPANPGRSFVELDTAASEWSATGELTIYGRDTQ